MKKKNSFLNSEKNKSNGNSDSLKNDSLKRYSIFKSDLNSKNNSSSNELYLNNDQKYSELTLNEKNVKFNEKDNNTNINIEIDNSKEYKNKMFNELDIVNKNNTNNNNNEFSLMRIPSTNLMINITTNIPSINNSSNITGNGNYIYNCSSKKDSDKQSVNRTVSSNLINSDFYKSNKFDKNLEISNNENINILKENILFSSVNNFCDPENYYMSQFLSKKTEFSNVKTSYESFKENDVNKNFNPDNFYKFNMRNNAPNSNFSFCNFSNQNNSMNSNNNIKDHRITNFFKTASKNQSIEEPTNLAYPTCISCQDKKKLENKVNELKNSTNLQAKTISDQKILIESLKCTITDIEDKNKTLNDDNHILTKNLIECRSVLTRIIKEKENIMRQNKREWINQMTIKISRPSNRYNIGNEYWEDGFEISEIKNELNSIEKKKEELSQIKFDIQSLIDDSNNNKKLSILDSTMDIYEIDLNEKRDMNNLLYEKILSKEVDLKKKLLELEKEKILLQVEYKRFSEEEICKYSSINNKFKEKWPILSERYILLSLLGKGGYSEVYKAFDLNVYKEVAIKIHQLNNNWNDALKDSYIKHTIRENQINELISHKHIVKHYDTIGIDNDCFCTILELCTGPDLSTYMKLNKIISEKEAKIIITQILSALKYLSIEKKVIHYDLKPQNIIFDNGYVKISDFGLSKIMEENQDKIELTSQGVGTYWYLPPECFVTNEKSNINSKVDIWSLGVIFYEMLFGKRPFAHFMSQERILKEGAILNAKKVEFPLFPTVSSECKDFIKKCLKYNVEDRWNVQDAFICNYIRKHKLN